MLKISISIYPSQNKENVFSISGLIRVSQRETEVRERSRYIGWEKPVSIESPVLSLEEVLDLDGVISTKVSTMRRSNGSTKIFYLCFNRTLDLGFYD